MRARRALVLAVSGGAAAALAVTAAAQVMEGPAPVLHRDVRSPLGAGGRRPDARPPATSSSSVLGEEPAPGRNPAAIGTGEKILPEPPTSEPRAGEEPVLGTRDFGADRITEFAADDQTGGDDTLTYVEAFNPSIVPFKRMTALDAVDASYTLHVGESTLADVPVGGTPTAGWDRFWGSVLVQLEPGREVPLPSVAPGMRILSYESEPKTQLTFSRDGADNFYVRSDETGARGQHRVVFLVEADPVYFAPRVPHRVRLSEIARSPGAPRIPPLPDNVRAMARTVHSYMRINPERDYLATTLDRLVEYHREFEPRSFSSTQGGLYYDLTINKAGVCRHRSFAFVVTAMALGIPARFVANEAHAFTEVWVPESGWIRIDLGGASDRLDVRGAENKAMYRPRGKDPFPRPAAYTEGGYSTLDGTLSGLTPEQVTESQTPRSRDGDGPPGSGEGDGDGEGEGEGEGGEGEGGEVDPDSGANPGRPSLGPGPGLPEIPAEARRGKKPTSIRISTASAVGFRGETVRVEGTVRSAADDERGLAGLRVEVYLAPAGKRGDGAHLVGTTVSRDDGSYAVDVLVPFDLALDEHEVFAGTPGSANWQPALTR